MSRSARRSARSTCARSRTRSGDSLPGPDLRQDLPAHLRRGRGRRPAPAGRGVPHQARAERGGRPAAAGAVRRGAAGAAATAPLARRRAARARRRGRRRSWSPSSRSCWCSACSAAGTTSRRSDKAADTSTQTTAKTTPKAKPTPKPAPPAGVTVAHRAAAPTYACMDTGEGTDRVRGHAGGGADLQEREGAAGEPRQARPSSLTRERQDGEDPPEPGAARATSSRRPATKELTEGSRPCA